MALKRHFKGQTAESLGVKQRTPSSARSFGKIRPGTVSGQNHRLDGQTVFGGKFVVALIVTRNGHHRASAVPSGQSLPPRPIFAS